MEIEIRTNRFVLRPLTLDDVTERYAGWLRDEAAKRYIVSARAQDDIGAVRKYVADRIDRADVLFLGIFTADRMLHIGNIKFEPVDPASGTAVMGILIGDPQWRGKGVAGEVLMACGEWLRSNRGVTRMVLGVERDNAAAVTAYEKVGFSVVSEDGSVLKMVRDTA